MLTTGSLPVNRRESYRENHSCFLLILNNLGFIPNKPTEA